MFHEQFHQRKRSRCLHNEFEMATSTGTQRVLFRSNLRRPIAASKLPGPRAGQEQIDQSLAQQVHRIRQLPAEAAGLYRPFDDVFLELRGFGGRAPGRILDELEWRSQLAVLAQQTLNSPSASVNHSFELMCVVGAVELVVHVRA